MTLAAAGSTHLDDSVAVCGLQGAGVRDRRDRARREVSILCTVLRAAQDASSGEQPPLGLVVALVDAAAAVSEDLARTLAEGQVRTSPSTGTG